MIETDIYLIGEESEGYTAERDQHIASELATNTAGVYEAVGLENNETVITRRHLAELLDLAVVFRDEHMEDPPEELHDAIAAAQESLGVEDN